MARSVDVRLKPWSIMVGDDMRSIPLVLLMAPGLARYRFPVDQCVYQIDKGPRLTAAWGAVLEELLIVEPERDISRQIPLRRS